MYNIVNLGVLFLENEDKNIEYKALLNNHAEIEFDSEVASEQTLSFFTAKSIFSQLNINFDEKALKLVNGNEYNNSALLISEQNPYITKLAVYEGVNVDNFKDKKEFRGSGT